jgi:hypothetical protein
VQDVPISKPLSRSDVARLQEALDAAQELPEVCGEFSHGILQFLISFAIRKTLLSFI